MAKSPPQTEAPALRFDLPALVERLTFPEPYAAHWACVRLDSPDQALTTLETKAQVLAAVVTDWSFTLADGSAAPRSEAAMLALSDQAPPLFTWLYEEWQQRRWRPLASTPTPTNGVS